MLDLFVGDRTEAVPLSSRMLSTEQLGQLLAKCNLTYHKGTEYNDILVNINRYYVLFTILFIRG